MERKKTEIRRQKMIDAAFSIFCEKGIEVTSIVDIAREANVGEATVYRYFSNKENLALECGKQFWSTVREYYDQVTTREHFQKENGMGRVEILLRCAYPFYEEHWKKFRLIQELDGFILSHKVETKMLEAYEIAVDSLRPYLCDALERGKTDGSIVENADTISLYYAMTNGIFSLMQKQATAGTLLSSDRIVEQKKKIILFLELVIAGFRASYGKGE